MKAARLIIASILAIGLVLTTLWTVASTPSSAAPSRELHVCSNGCMYGTVQAAVDAADAGDVIKVAGGTYTGMDTSDQTREMIYVDKSVAILGGYSSSNWDLPDPVGNPTILDGEGGGRVFHIVGDVDVALEGLHITGGDTTAWGDWEMGGGVYAVTATLAVERSWIYHNAAEQGGGIATEYGETTISATHLTSNTAEYGGGGLSIWHADVMLQQNTVRANEAGGLGGAHLHRSSATLIGNAFEDNVSQQDAGGLGLYDCQAMLNGNVIAGNTGTRYGGGILWAGGGDESWMVNNVIIDNRTSGYGSGLYIEGYPLHLLHNTVAWNSDTGDQADDVGVYVTAFEPWTGDNKDSDVVMTNTLLVGHGIGISVTGSNAVALDGVLWDGSTPITVSHSPAAIVSLQSQYTGDPDLSPDHYHLGSSSAAIDAGVDGGLILDIDGDGRPIGAGPDLGADEWAAVVSETVGPAGDSVLIATVRGLTTSVTVPADAVTETLTLGHRALARPKSSPQGFAFAGRAFDLGIYRGDAPVPGFKFQDGHPATITIGYCDDDLSLVTAEDSLVLRHWDGQAWLADGITPAERNLAQNYVRFAVSHLTQFALFGETRLIYLPLVVRTYR